ncbi:MAG: TetR/AcrR family transcriptional regulator [Pseudomonadota bacterium]
MTGSRGRPIDQEKRAAVLKAAGHLFFTRGLDTVRLDDIARDAGVSKMTIYNAFGDKNGLFDAVVSDTSDEMVKALHDVTFADAPIEVALQAFGEELLSHLTKDDFLKIDSVLSALGGEDLAAARHFFDRGPGRVLKALADYLETRGRRGDLYIDDPAQAADDLVSLWQGQWAMRRRFGRARSMSKAAIKKRVAHGLSVFLKAYGQGKS